MQGIWDGVSLSIRDATCFKPVRSRYCTKVRFVEVKKYVGKKRNAIIPIAFEDIKQDFYKDIYTIFKSDLINNTGHMRIFGEQFDTLKTVRIVGVDCRTWLRMPSETL